MEPRKTVRRPQLAERIRQAKELASTQNTAEYDDAKNDQAFVEGRILTLEKLIQDARIINEEEAHHASAVQIGSTVHLVDGEGKRTQYTIVGSAEAGPKASPISNASTVSLLLFGNAV